VARAFGDEGDEGCRQPPRAQPPFGMLAFSWKALAARLRCTLTEHTGVRRVDSGVFIDEEGAGKHITAGAKKVVITAPGKGAIPTYVLGVNAHEMTGEEPIVSNASCTTNGMACFVKVRWNPTHSLTLSRSARPYGPCALASTPRLRGCPRAVITHAHTSGPRREL
jgi:hypothetical protein